MFERKTTSVRVGRVARREGTLARGRALLAMVALVLAASPIAVAAQEEAAGGMDRPTLTPADYDRWESLGSFELDATGSWLVAAIGRVDGPSELRLHRADGTGDPLVVEWGRSPEFSADGRWMAYLKTASEDEREASEEPIPDRLGLVDLRAGTDTVLFEVASFAFRDDGVLLAAHGVAPSDSVGADLLVLDLGARVEEGVSLSETRTVIGNVSEFAWRDEGRLLAATLKTSWGAANGVVLFDPEASTLRTLDSGDGEYVELTWWEESSQLAVLRSVESDDREEASHDILVWDDAGGSPVRVLPAVAGPLPPETRITPYRGLTFSEDGRSLFLGVRPWEPKADEDGRDGTGGEEGGDPGDQEPGDDEPEEGESDEEEGENGDEDVEPADVQIWHWDDDLILRAQEYRAGQLARRTRAAVWHMDDDRLVILGDELEESVRVVAGGRWGLVPDYDPYLFQRRFGARTADWYRVDTRTGERTLLAEGLEFGIESQDEGARALVYRDDAWSVVDLGSLEWTTVADGRSFTRPLRAYDYPGPRPSWGTGGWTADGSSAFVYDEHDVWSVELGTGTAERLTRGAEAGRRYRLQNLDPDAFPFLPVDVEADDDLWYSVFDLRTKESGYARGAMGGAPETLVFEDARLAGLTRSEDGDRLALRMERWDDSPDVFVGDADLDGLVQVTRTNPFQDDFAWGRTELLGYTTDAGHDLQAILAYPAGFEEGRRYPLILYQYERLSDGLHGYHGPSEQDYYDFQTWSQQGYFVLMPDIVYEPGRPGPSALDAVEHALDAAVATGHVDPGRMGLIGHSWGGYQAAYLPTRTDRFAASVAGAAITNFLSFMGAVHWNGGLPETGHWETGQARMAVPYWEDLEGHLESSPANYIFDLETPMLLMHGDEDGVVDFYQGMEFYNYARRAGKEVILLVYPGADHGLREEAQQVDYHRRILEWFGHYLKDEPAPTWITEGETWVERDRRMKGS